MDALHHISGIMSQPFKDRENSIGIHMCGGERSGLVKQGGFVDEGQTLDPAAGRTWI